MAGRRPRNLSAEDLRLWDEVAATATPLRPPAAPPEPAPPDPPAVPRDARPATATSQRPAPRPPEPPRVTVALAPDPHAGLRMDRRRFDKLRRGRLEPEARIDLHGMTSERAHAALTGFILEAHDRDLRLVLVITGKGRADEDALGLRRHGILRHSLPHWLAMPPLTGRVLQLTSAHQRHGGAGAFYVYLRRRRSPPNF